MAPHDIEIGQAYVIYRDGARGLQEAGLAIALIVGRASGDRFLACARIGSDLIGGWRRHPRVVRSADIRRPASRREVIVNLPIDPVPRPV